MLLAFVRHRPLLLVFAAMFGLVDYSVVPLVVSLVGSYCGADAIGLTVGILLMWHSFGAGLGSWFGYEPSNPNASHRDTLSLPVRCVWN